MHDVEKILPTSEYHLQIRILREIFRSDWLAGFPTPLVNDDVTEP